MSAARSCAIRRCCLGVQIGPAVRGRDALGQASNATGRTDVRSARPRSIAAVGRNLQVGSRTVIGYGGVCVDGGQDPPKFDDRVDRRSAAAESVEN